MRSPHKKAHPACASRTWGDCDKVSANRYADWQAMQQVILAYRLVVAGKMPAFMKDDSLMGQLVRLIGGKQAAIQNDDGTESRGAWTKRILAAVQRMKDGDLPAYNLYELPKSGGR